MSQNNYISVQINQQPNNFDFFQIGVYATGNNVYNISLFAQFVSGSPINVYQVAIGSTLENTVTNLYQYFLQNYSSDSNLVITQNATIINFEFLDLADYAWSQMVSHSVNTSVFVASSAPSQALEPMPPLRFKDVSIEIIDTYENNRPLNVELTKQGSCQISWNGGDDLFKEIMSSAVEFNMLVADRSDAHFIHLLTGDENRFLVKVNGIDEDNNVQLIWQGFLLPDQYREPWTVGNVFVDFKATDCIAALKGKYLKPWYYQNKFPITVLLSYILENTGLNQPMLIKPSIVPGVNFLNWEMINIDLQYYREDNGFKDLYTILTDVLKANLLTLKSFRGYWWIEGLTRKKDEGGFMIAFDAKGRFLGVQQFIKNKYPLLMKEGTVSITAVTPFKKVNYEWKVSGSQNMYSEDVVGINKTKIFYSRYFYDIIENQYNSFATHKFLDWQNFLDPLYFSVNVFNRDNLNYRIRNIDGAYNCSEAQALQNYLLCNETVFVKPELLYEIEFDFLWPEDLGISQPVSGQQYNNFIPFQLFLNGNEIVSNRPSFPAASMYSFVVKSEGQNRTSFSLKTTFFVQQRGELSLRVLAPILNRENAGTFDITCTKLQLKSVDEYDSTENISASQDINYTREYDLQVNLGCSEDKSIKNSFGIGLPTNSNYFTILRDFQTSSYQFDTNQFFAPATTIHVDFSAWFLPDGMFEILFQRGWKKAVFLQSQTVGVIPFDNLYGSRNQDFTKRAAFIINSSGNPRMPKDYFIFQDYDNAVDKILVMYVRYGAENYINRLSWKIYDSSIIREFSKCIVTAVHNVYFETLYSLECDVLDMVWPDDLPRIFFDQNDRNFIPTNISIDLFGGQTRFVGTEAKYKEMNDLVYE